MRPGFETHLRDLSKLEKEKAQPGIESKKRAEFRTAAVQLAEERAEERGTSTDAQLEIIRLQEKKQKRMRELKRELACLDDPKCAPERRPGDHLASYNESSNTYYLKEQGMEPITLGEIMTDMEWGNNYHLDPETVPRQARKRYLVEQTKASLRSRLDEQIITEESSSQLTDTLKQEAFKKVRESKEAELRQAGLIAEKMVRNFLKKLSIDYGLDYEIIEADVSQDVEQKIDFIISFKHHSSGVKVEADEHIKTLGIQFTINSSPEVLEHKESQVKHSKRALRKGSDIQNIILVHVSMADVTRVYQDWSRDKKSGGPDKLLPLEVREKIFKAVLGGGGKLKPEQLNEQWAAIVGPKKTEYALAA